MLSKHEIMLLEKLETDLSRTLLRHKLDDQAIRLFLQEITKCKAGQVDIRDIALKGKQIMNLIEMRLNKVKEGVE